MKKAEPKQQKLSYREESFIMHPTVDFCFKELMQNEKIRKGFLAAVLHVRPEQISRTVLLPTILRKEYEEDKIGILDVRVELEDGSQVDIEMQVLAFPWWAERTVFYLCKMYADQIHSGDMYDKLKKCIHIGILDFVLFPEDEEFYSCFHLREEKRGRLYTDRLEIHTLELPKLENCDDPEDELLRWAKFFHAKKKEEFQEMAKKDEYIKEACETLEKLSGDEEKRLEYEAREKAIRDYDALVRGARLQGIEEGIEKGIEKGVEQGRDEGEKLFAELTRKMLQNSRMNDLIRAAEDKEFRDEMYREYGIK